MIRLLYLTVVQGKVRVLPREIQIDDRRIYHGAREAGLPEGWRPLREKETLRDDEEVMHYSIFHDEWCSYSRADALPYRDPAYAMLFILVRA